MKNVRIGGVPEHFNYAWYLALKQGHFKQHNIEVRWKDYFGGTGQMTKATVFTKVCYQFDQMILLQNNLHQLIL